MRRRNDGPELGSTYDRGSSRPPTADAPEHGQRPPQTRVQGLGRAALRAHGHLRRADRPQPHRRIPVLRRGHRVDHPRSALIVAGIPDSYDCGYANPRYGCQVPGSGSGEQIFFGIVLLFLSVFVAWGLTVWNRVWRVHKTGQSVGRKMMGLRVINAHTGTHPEFGSAVLRELVHQFASIISWIWMLVDDDDRTLADIVGTTHVVRTGTR